MRIIPALCAAAAVASCGSSPGLLPNATLQLTPLLSYTTEQIYGAGLAGVLIYVVYDPLAPNWNIEEKVLNEDTYALSMKAKSFRTGGDGESMRILKRRALTLQRERGYTSYKILEFSEGIESSTPFTHRFSEGTIQLVRAGVVPKR